VTISALKEFSGDAEARIRTAAIRVAHASVCTVGQIWLGNARASHTLGRWELAVEIAEGAVRIRAPLVRIAVEWVIRLASDEGYRRSNGCGQEPKRRGSA
jgi:hypothetical protein